MVKQILDVSWNGGAGLEELQLWAAEMPKAHCQIIQSILGDLKEEDKILRESGLHSIDADKLSQLESIYYVLDDCFAALSHTLDRFIDEIGKTAEN